MRSRKPATYQDLLGLPANLVGEIVAGELVASPRPAFGHAHAASILGSELTGPFGRGRGGPGGWLLLYEPELHLGEDVLVPDFAGWRRQRLPQLPPPSEPFFSLAPDWICEVLSPSTARIDRVLKMRIYAREGVSHFWLLDPLARTLEVFRLRDGQWVKIGGYAEEERVRAEPFDAIELELGALWPPAAAPHP